MDITQIIITVIPALISGSVAYYTATNRFKIEFKKLESDMDKMKLLHEQELEKIKLNQSNKEEDLKLEYIAKVLDGRADLNDLIKLKNKADKLTNQKRRP